MSFIIKSDILKRRKSFEVFTSILYLNHNTSLMQHCCKNKNISINCNIIALLNQKDG